MNDQNSQFQAILTAVGEAKQANADTLGIPWTFAQMAVGDANGIDPFPDRLQTKLINERRRAPLNQLKPDPENPGVIIAEQVIPESVGGFWIRELGLYDQDGDLVAVANCPGTYKPLMAQGSGRTQIIRMNLIVSSLANIVLKIDPSVVLATRQYVDELFQTNLPGNKPPGTYRQVTINKHGIVQSGSNPTTLAGFGITDAYTKTEAGQSFASKAVTLAGYNIGDAYTKDQVDARLSNKADKATTLAGYGITDVYTKDEAGQGFASRAVTLAGYNIGDAYTKDQVDARLSNKADKATTLAGYGITDVYTKDEAGQGFASRAVTLAGYNIGDAYTKDQVDARLSNKADKASTLAGYGIADAYTKTEAGQSFASRAVTLAGYNIGDAYTKTQIDGSLSGKADKATTLAGYGITDAYTRTQADQRLDGKAPNVAASESVAGISSVSTQNQTNAGLDDATFVTPKKLRAGFLSSFTLNGFIAFPTWLGGLIIQWGRTASLGDGNSTTVSLPLTFPATTLQMWTSIYGDVSGDSTACRVSAGQFLSLSQIKVSYNETTSALGGAAVTWICVGF